MILFNFKLSLCALLLFTLSDCGNFKTFKQLEGNCNPEKPLPTYDHIVIVVEENKDYSEIIGNRHNAPYINKTLVAEGASITNMYAEEHHSQGNYFWLLSGDNQNVGFDDIVPTQDNNPNYPFAASNLGAQLIQKGLTFKGYSEDLPSIGFIEAKSGNYVRKHVPWISFANIPNGSTFETSSNVRFLDFPTDPSQYDKLPTVSFVIPNVKHDMHDGRPPKSVKDGDQWLKINIDRYYQWAKDHNSLLIITFDENESGRAKGLSNPKANPTFCGKTWRHCIGIQNRIPTIFAGAHIKHGKYKLCKGVTHVNLLRTLEKMYHLDKSGAQQIHALKAGISDDYIISDIFE